MDRNQGITADPLFVGMTRPPMKFGVTYVGLIVNAIVTMEVFIVTKNLLWLLSFFPVHGVLYLICLYEPMFFELLILWGRTRCWAIVTGIVRFWKANSYSPLALDFPDRKGRRKAVPDRIVI